MERIRILESSKFLDLDIDGMNIEDVVTHFKNIADSYEKDIMMYDKLVTIERTGYHDDGREPEWDVVVYRWETDWELAKREAQDLKKQEIRLAKIANVKKIKDERLAKNEASEKAEYERLKAKYGK